MKKCIRKLLYSSLVAFISIGINFNVEARVTKEVAEATLPYLMEAAGIPGDEEDTEHIDDAKTTVKANESWYKKDKIQAILSMIYTDEGQQQMVKWVQDGRFPMKLTRGGFVSNNTYQNSNYRKATLSSLFPCQTGTFTSFANHQSRLGLHVLSNNLALSIVQFLKQTKTVDQVIGNTNFQNFEESNRSFHGKSKRSDPLIDLPIDVLLAKVIFILDIVDAKSILVDILTRCEVGVPLLEGVKNNAEYTVRPLPAIVAENIIGKLDGDCVETLYRHLINIAIHDNGSNKFHIERLPAELRKYYVQTDRYFDEVRDNLMNAPGLELLESEAGLTNIERHKHWKSCLQNTLTAMFQTRIGSDFYNEIVCSKEMSSFCISIGSITYIANILHEIAFFNTFDEYLDKNLQGDEKNSVLMQNAMNKLSNAKNRFEVNIGPKEEDDPVWTNKVITIKDSSSTQKIRVGLQTNGHAEIVKIETLRN